jgi:hypothetical protein
MSPLHEHVERAPESLVARTEGDGFYVRLYPQPDVRWPVVVGGAALWLGASGALAWGMGGGSSELTRLLFGCLAIFGLMLYAFFYGHALMPVEIVACDSVVFFAGERFPGQVVTALEEQGSALVLKGPSGELGRVTGIGPTARSWVREAFTTWRSGA